MGCGTFGYVITNPQSLPKERQNRFRAFYCGLCRTLRRQYGLKGALTLSYDMTFLAVLLNALYEPEETAGAERCPAHPLRRHDYVTSEVVDYAAAMNLALAYHKMADNWRDDHSLLSAGEMRLFEHAYSKVSGRYSDKCRAIEAWLDEIHAIENTGAEDIDPPVNATGRLLGELFVYRSGDAWEEWLRGMGDGLGRFIYFMDAYEDLPGDLRHGRFNVLKGPSQTEGYEEMCHSAMLMMLGDAAGAFEQLPIVLDEDILRNILYSGVWSKYAFLQKKRRERK